RCGLGLFAAVDGGDRSREAPLLSRACGSRSAYAAAVDADRRFGGSKMNFRKKFLVKPGRKFKLSDIDPDFHGGMSEDDGEQELEKGNAKLTEMQRLFYGDRSRALLVVLQGIDGAGKDGTCWHVISAMDPQGVKVQGFKQPTPEEQAHDFLWRIHPHA